MTSSQFFVPLQVGVEDELTSKNSHFHTVLEHSAVFSYMPCLNVPMRLSVMALPVAQVIASNGWPSYACRAVMSFCYCQTNDFAN